MRCGSTIRKLREQAGMTQSQLAQAIDRCIASVSFYERNKRDMPWSVIERIAHTFKVSPLTLFTDDDPESSSGPPLATTRGQAIEESDHVRHH